MHLYGIINQSCGAVPAILNFLAEVCVMIRSKIVSSLENCFLDSSFESFAPMGKITALRNERFSFQYVCLLEGNEEPFRRTLTPKIEGELAAFATLREVRSVPVTMPVIPGVQNDNYLRTTPGLYPDILYPLVYDGSVYTVKTQLKSIWVELDLRDVADRVPVGESTLRLSYYDGETEVTSAETCVEIIDARLPKQELIFTEWFYCDCLADYYHCEVWSERHWEIVENFARVAKSNGINMILTPVFTPSLDTRIGGERPTTQLVGVTKTSDGYAFDYTLLDRWIDMCDRVGFEYYEIAHFFTQWGAKHAPKVMAYVDGEYRKIFGWDTDATSDEYVGFLRAFIKDFLAYMKAKGYDKRCYFHISDEPSADQLPYYKAAKDSIADLLDGYVIMDALSNYEFYSEGVVSTPIPCNDHITPFIENKVQGLWTYYCSSQWKNVSNRFISMPSYRNRSIGMQMYKYDIVGFLHWGYNFFNTCGSFRTLDPFGDTCGFDWVPAGDTCSVYPGSDGCALESIRIAVFYDSIQDMSAMKLAESLCGKNAVVRAIENAFGGEITFAKCALSSQQMTAVRKAVNDLIKSNVK